jgi:hypothetical protein
LRQYRVLPAQKSGFQPPRRHVAAWAPGVRQCLSPLRLKAQDQGDGCQKEFNLCACLAVERAQPNSVRHHGDIRATSSRHYNAMVSSKCRATLAVARDARPTRYA